MTLPERHRGRYAPSPTGPLHLGNLRTALLAWLSARSRQASFVLRIEDLDARRSRPQMVTQIIEDLCWLGLDWDEGPDVGGQFAPYDQSLRAPLYTAALARLAESGMTYPCYCSRADVADRLSGPAKSDAGYDGRCRDEAGRAAQHSRKPLAVHAIRFRVEQETIEFDDGICGTKRFNLRPGIDDFVVWRSDQTAAYQLAVVVDDAAMAIDEVVRGEDLLTNTPWQIVLYRALCLAQPRFAHVPLWLDTRGAKLSKRDASSGLDVVRGTGMTQKQVVGMIAASCGLAPTGAECLPRDLIAGFTMKAVRSARAPLSHLNVALAGGQSSHS